MNYKYFKKMNEGKLIYFPLKNKIFSIFCIVLIILAIVFNLKYSNADLGEAAIVFRLMSFIVPIIWLSQSSSKIEIDVKNKTLNKHFFYGLIKKSNSLDHFSHFQVIRNTTNLIYNGTDLVMKFKKEEKTNDIKICRMRNTVKLDELKLEITKIMNSAV